YAYNQLKKMGTQETPTGRMGAARKTLRAKNGNKSKKSYYAVWVSRMFVEFLESDGEQLNVWRREIDGRELYAIREGAWTLKQVTYEVENLLNKAKNLGKTSKLPD